MDFKTPYLLAMREQAPKLFMELRKSGRLDQFLQQKAIEASRLKDEILKGKKNPSLQDERTAEEIVFSQMIEFSPEGFQPSLEPPEDLPTHPGA